MLGSVSDAEDVVHDVFLSAMKVDEANIENVKAFLCKVTTNRCIDMLRSARKRREVYVGPWLPEPIMTENLPSPSEFAVEHESMSYAYVLMMEKLTPYERAAFLLHNVLEFRHDEIALILNKSNAACRKYVQRAKQKLEGATPLTNSNANQELIEAFIHSLVHGNVPKLLQLISEDAILYSDGGGKVKAAINPIISAKQVAAFLTGLMKKTPSGFSYQIKMINRQPGIVNTINGAVHSVVMFKLSENKIEQIYLIVNPDKLTKI